MSFVKAPNSIGHAPHRSDGGVISSVDKLLRYDPAIDPYYDNVVLLLEGESRDKSKYNNQYMSNAGAGFNNGVIKSDGWAVSRIRIREAVPNILTVPANINFTLEGRWKLTGRTPNETPALLHNEEYPSPNGSAVFYLLNNPSRMVLIRSDGAGTASVSRNVDFTDGVESEISISRIDGVFYWHKDGQYLGQNPATGVLAGEFIFGYSSGAAVIQRTVTVNPCNVEVSRLRLTIGTGRYGASDYVTPITYDPFATVQMHPYWKDTVFCLDGDVYNGLVDLTGRQQLNFTGVGAWDTANRQTGGLNRYGFAQILYQDNDDFLFPGDVTVEGAVAVTNLDLEARIIAGNVTPTTTSESSFVFIFPQALNCRVQGGDYLIHTTFDDTDRKVWRPGTLNHFRYVRKGFLQRMYINGAANVTLSAVPTTNTRLFKLKHQVADNHIGIGGFVFSASDTSIIVKRLRVVKAALNNPADLNHRVPRNFLE